MVPRHRYQPPQFQQQEQQEQQQQQQQRQRGQNRHTKTLKCGESDNAGDTTTTTIMSPFQHTAADQMSVNSEHNNNPHEEKKMRDPPSSPTTTTVSIVHGGPGGCHSSSPQFSSPQRPRPICPKSNSYRLPTTTNMATMTTTPTRAASATTISFRRSPSLDQHHHENRTKSWTDQRAPEPFSSPPSKSHHHQKQTTSNDASKKKKYGYGDLFRSSSSGIGGDGGGVPHDARNNSLRGSRPGMSRPLYRSDRNVFANADDHANDAAIRRGNSEGGRVVTSSSSASNARLRPMFARSDFPLLSPARPKRPTVEGREASWSAKVTGNSVRDVTTTTASSPSTSAIISSADTTVAITEKTESDSFDPIVGIPPLPLCNGTRSVEVNADDSYIDTEVETLSSGEGDSIAEPTTSLTIQPLLIHSQQQHPPRQRSRSFHHYSPNDYDSSPKNNSFALQPMPSNELYHPFSSFTTMSIAALQNDIGTVLARSNRVQEAIMRYRLCIASAKSALDELQHQDGISEGVESVTQSKRETGQWAKCPKVTEAEGLAWFRQKLLRGDVLSASEVEAPEENASWEPTKAPFQPAGFGGCAPPTPRRLRSASFSVADACPPHKQLSMPSTAMAESLSSIGVTHSIDEVSESPMLHPTNLAARMLTCPATAPHPGKIPVQLSRSHSARSAGGGSHRRATAHHAHPHHAPLDDIVHDIHQHQKLDCPDEVYSCNGLTPLGLEYICDPLPVLGSSLRRLVTPSSGNTKNGNGLVQKGKRTAVMESAALIAARLNLASLEYRIAGGGTSDKLQEVLTILESALEDCHAASKIIESLGESCKTKFSTVFCLLKAVVYSNIGAVKYRLKKVRESMASFEAARAALEDDHDRPIEFHHYSEPHDDNRFPPRSYLLLVVRLNLSRVSLRLNQSDDAEKYCDLISEDSKPHRRNSNRLRNNSSLLQGGGGHRGFRRSNSFSAASSALETSIAAYEHDIDRRLKWLSSVAEHYIAGLIHEAKGEANDYKEACHHYNRLLSLARTKLDHRHAYIVALLERRGAVLFEQRKLPCSMLSYLACLKILEHQQSTGSNAFDEADLSRVLYGIARVLHDKEEYHDALHMYQRALACQRALAADAGRPSLDVITTLCNISRVHHLAGEIDASLAANREVLELALVLVGGKKEHPFLIHRLKVEGNILVEAGRLEDAMKTFVEAARRCSEDGRDRMITAMMGGGGGGSSSQEDADAGDSSVLSIRSASALAQINFIHPAAPAA